MKKYLLLSFACVCISFYGNAQMSIYVRLTDYDSKVLTTSGLMAESLAVGNSIEPGAQFIKVEAFSNDIEQSLSLTSTSTGASAGRVTFNPVSVTRKADAMSPQLLQRCSSAKAFKTMEVFFTNAQNVIVAKQIYKMVGVKTVAWSAACATGCDGIKEVTTFEYGGQLMAVPRPGFEGKQGMSEAGWNKIRNTPDNDPSAEVH